ncbi:MAG: hypothetical protein ABJ215_04965 [Alphaproteobacteria bacterium]
MSAERTDLFGLTTDRIDMVFPLAREADPRLSLEAWRHFAGPRVETDSSDQQPPGILLAARNTHIRGLAAYDMSPEAGCDNVLRAHHIVIIDRTRERHLAMDLLGGLMHIAEAARCNRVRALLPPTSRWLHTRWSDPGGRVFRLPVECLAVPDSAGPRDTSGATTVVDFRRRT